MRLGALCTLWLTIAALVGTAAADGRLEISQTGVDASGGFPITLTAPGSYVLTSDLVVPASTDAIVLETSEVVIDLNGFAIRGAFACNVGACAAGSGSAIRPGLSVAFGRESTLRNGRVRGFAGDCVSLSTGARVEDLMVSDCGLDGIDVSSGSLVSANRVTRTGEHGIRMSGSLPVPSYERNAVSAASRGGGAFFAISGGRPSGGNSCDDGSCSTDGRRRYYLTTTAYTGGHGTNVCDFGFHMAAMFELLDVSNLAYDTTRGVAAADSGAGPPARRGWVRTGEFTFLGSSACGASSTDPWTSSLSNESGTTAFPFLAVAGIGADGAPRWLTEVVSCDDAESVWCVED